MEEAAAYLHCFVYLGIQKYEINKSLNIGKEDTSVVYTAVGFFLVDRPQICYMCLGGGWFVVDPKVQ